MKKLADLGEEARTDHPQIAAILFTICGAICFPMDLRDIFIAVTDIAQRIVDTERGAAGGAS